MTNTSNKNTGFTAESIEVSFTVNDVATSLAWYRDVMGFALERTHEREGLLIAASLRAGNVRILVTQDNGARGADRVKGEGFSIQFTTTQDVDAVAARVKAAGAVLETEPMDGFGARIFRLRDPDGFKLVVSSKRA